MKKVAIILGVLLISIIIVETYLYVNKTIANQQLSFQVNQLQTDKQKLENEKSDLQINIGKLAEENNSLRGEVKKIEGEKGGLTTQVTKLTKDVSNLKSKMVELMTENSSLTSKFMCKDRLSNVDFTSPNTVNSALVKYVESIKNREEPVSSHYWNVVWTNNNYSIHTVIVKSEKDNTNYLWKFTAYFKGEAHGQHQNAVFYNDDQCWLYLDK